MRDISSLSNLEVLNGHNYLRSSTINCSQHYTSLYLVVYSITWLSCVVCPNFMCSKCRNLYKYPMVSGNHHFRGNVYASNWLSQQKWAFWGEWVIFHQWMRMELIRGWSSRQYLCCESTSNLWAHIICTILIQVCK